MNYCNLKFKTPCIFTHTNYAKLTSTCDVSAQIRNCDMQKSYLVVSTGCQRALKLNPVSRGNFVSNFIIKKSVLTRYVRHRIASRNLHFCHTSILSGPKQNEYNKRMNYMCIKHIQWMNKKACMHRTFKLINWSLNANHVHNYLTKMVLKLSFL